MMTSRLKTIGWFLKRPQYLSHAAYIAYRNILPDKERYRKESTRWAESHAIAINDAFVKLNIEYQPGVFDIKFADLRQHGDSVKNTCPIEMGGEGCLELLSTIARSTKSGQIIETGVAYGWSASAILFGLQANKDRFLHSIDLPYIQGENDKWVGCVVPDSFRRQWKLYRGSDRMLLKKVLSTIENDVAMVHYDSDKSYYGRIWAYPKLWRALSAGGYFISDDIQDNFAFKEFTESLGLPFVIINHMGKHVGIIQKP